MDNSVPYEGNGDANNHSGTLNKTLDHAMMVRTHTFTAHRTHAPRTACTTVHSNGSGCSILACPKKPQPCPPYSLYCKPSLRCQPQRAARRHHILRHQPTLCAASHALRPPANPLCATSPPAYPLRLRHTSPSSAPPAYILRAASLSSAPPAYPGRKVREVPLCAPFAPRRTTSRASCPHTPKSYLVVEQSHEPDRSPIAGSPGLRSAQQVRHVPSPEGHEQHQEPGG